MEMVCVLVFLLWALALIYADKAEKRKERTKETVIDWMKKRKGVRRSFLIEKITGLLKNCEPEVDWKYHINIIINEMIEKDEFSVTQANGFELLSLNSQETEKSSRSG